MKHVLWRYRYFLIAPIVVLLMTLLLLWLSGGPQRGGFVYQMY